MRKAGLTLLEYLALVKRLVYPALSRRLSLNIKDISTASMNYSQRYDPIDQYRYFNNIAIVQLFGVI